VGCKSQQNNNNNNNNNNNIKWSVSYLVHVHFQWLRARLNEWLSKQASKFECCVQGGELSDWKGLWLSERLSKWAKHCTDHLSSVLHKDAISCWVYMPSVIDKRMSMGNSWYDAAMRNRSTPRKTYSWANMSTTNPTSAGLKMKPSLCDENPPTNRLRHGTTIYIYIYI
jgi:hypothetical protein